jgi:hypothetical protein
MTPSGECGRPESVASSKVAVTETCPAGEMKRVAPTRARIPAGSSMTEMGERGDAWAR